MLLDSKRLVPGLSNILFSLFEFPKRLELVEVKLAKGLDDKFANGLKGYLLLSSAFEF